MFYAITEAFNTLRDFMSSGGSVLWLIAILAGFMWAIILERIWYFNAGHKVYMQDIRSEWEAVGDHTTWRAQQIKDKLTSQAKTEVNKYLPLINTCVALAPLFGLLGTVTGMIEVFQVMAFTTRTATRLCHRRLWCIGAVILKHRSAMRTCIGACWVPRCAKSVRCRTIS